jgi:GxxExxY protein
MNAENQRQWLNSLSGSVIGAAQIVSTKLGYGFLEKVYENALCMELQKRGIFAEQQRPIHVFYDGMIVGDYIPDVLVQDAVIHLEISRVVNDF